VIECRQHAQFPLSGQVALVTQVQADFGAIDLLVNNAGMVQEGGHEAFTPRAEIEDAAWHACIARNLTTCHLVTRRVLPDMSCFTGQLVMVDGGNCLQERKG
jgi:NAD(P)-dependent dehydrogenase (short-subunit alcohol dehydrogenase family)